MTPPRRIWPVINQLFIGATVGLMVALALVAGLGELLGLAGVDRYELGWWSLAPVFPLWCWIVSLFAWPELKQQQAAYRLEAHCCKDCGYPLRGIRQTPGRCPECGTRFKGP